MSYLGAPGFRYHYEKRLIELPSGIAPWYQVGQPGFFEIGAIYVDLLQQYCGLRPDSQVLDVGCGIGRISQHLTGVLGQGGRYVGTDIVSSAIDWSRETFSGIDDFSFVHADIFNREYNRNGKARAREYRFPFADSSFDIAVLTSVFTHMLPAGTRQYLAELSRVLRPGGRVLMTFFLLNDPANAGMAAGLGNRIFHDCGQGVFSTTPRVPEAAIGQEESAVRSMLSESGFDLTGPIQYGRWSGRSDASPRDQDLIIGRRHDT